jgi:predicted dinucleotide-binding enzyme
MRITFLGIGKVGFALANNLQRLGHAVSIAVHNPGSESIKTAQARNPALSAKPLAQAVAEAGVIFLATPCGAVQTALRAAGNLAGKIIVDCTNPIGPGMSHALGGTISEGEVVQGLVPEARVVKAFNTSGYRNFIDTAYPAYPDIKPAMLIAGNDPAAKQVVSGLCEQLGWQPVDAGDISMSLQLEHMALLWIKMARQRGSNFVWAMLER